MYEQMKNRIKEMTECKDKIKWRWQEKDDHVLWVKQSVLTMKKRRFKREDKETRWIEFRCDWDIVHSPEQKYYRLFYLGFGKEDLNSRQKLQDASLLSLNRVSYSIGKS
jgi:hypothetical protein